LWHKTPWNQRRQSRVWQ